MKNYVTQGEIRAERTKFESWATKKCLEVGRDESGCYDDSDHGSAAWLAWFERAFYGRNFKRAK